MKKEVSTTVKTNLREEDYLSTDVYEGGEFPGFDEVDSKATHLWLDGKISGKEWADMLYAARADYLRKKSLVGGGKK